MSQISALSVPAVPSPAFPTTEKGGVISPAEAKFWQEWAAKAPHLVRSQLSESLDKVTSALTPYKVGGVALGAVLGGATFTKHVPGKWKILSGLSSAASLAFAAFMGSMQSASGEAEAMFLRYADALERNPALQQKLASYLSATVTAENLQSEALEKVVLSKALEFGLHTPYLKGMQADCGACTR
jgi:hypothetical protein